MEVKFTDRYSATGTSYPKWINSCRNCEGMGFYPTKDKSKWKENDIGDEVGYAFVTCEECKGSKKCSFMKSVCRLKEIPKRTIKYIQHKRFLNESNI